MADDGNRKIWGALVWFLNLLGLILVLVTDKKSDKELKFYGVQSTLYAISFWVLMTVLGIVGGVFTAIPYVGFIGSILLLLVTLAAFPVYALINLYCIWKAYNLEHIKLPVIGNLAEQWAEKL
jgi:uncharacterized membrane protein